MSDEVCSFCRVNGLDASALPPRERVFTNEFWRVRVQDRPVPGWLLVVLRRHVGTLSELSADEAATLGPVLAAGTETLMKVLGCEKSYVMSFTESVAHVHLHLVPRAPDLPPEFRAAAIFNYKAGDVTLGEAERDSLAERLISAWSSGQSEH